MRRSMLLPAALLTLLSVPAHAGPAATLEDLAWLEGRWVGDGISGREASETWLPAAGGQMAGHFYQVGSDGAVMFYELMTIAPDGEGSLVLRLKHFNADLSGWEAPDAAAAEEFALVAQADGRAEFDGLAYELRDDGRLRITVLVGNGGDAAQALVFDLTRQ